MQDPVEKLQSTETFKTLDRRVNWAQLVIFGTAGILVVVAVVKNMVFA